MDVTGSERKRASRLADFIRARQADIIAEWTRRARSLSPARDLSDVAIVDRIPGILLRIADRIQSPDAGAAPLGDLPRSHAVERLGRGFDLDQIVSEYTLLRRSILDLWHAANGPTIELTELRLLDTAFDESVAQSAARYAQAREKLANALDRVSEAALESVDVDAFLRDLLRVTLEGTEAVDTCVVLLGEDDRLRVRAPAGLEEELEPGFSMTAREGFAAEIAAAGRPLSLRDAANDPRVRSPVIHAKRVRALYGVPMIREGHVIGVAGIGSLTASEFSEEDKLLFRTVVSRATSAVVKAGILADLRRTETTQRFLSEASRQFAESLDYEATLAKIAHLAVPTIADWCVVNLIEGDTIRLVSVAHTDPEKERVAWELQGQYPTRLDEPGAIARVLRTGVPAWKREIADADWTAPPRNPEHLQLIRKLGLRSYVVVPIVSRRRVLGAIALVMAESKRQYSQSDLAVAEDLAGRAATAIDNARLYTEAQSAIASRQHVLAVVSHDLWNQLGVLAAGAELLARKADTGGEDLAKPIDTIRRTTRAMQRLVGDLVDLAAIQAGQLSIDVQTVDVGALLDEARESHDALARAKQIRLVCDCPGNIHVRADRARILQAVANLLGNAVKFTPSGGTITLRAARGEREATISVADTGPGIPADELPTLFEPYRSIERHGKTGTGLGLYITKGIVQRHGGRLSVESTVGGGTTFSFTVPRA